MVPGTARIMHDEKKFDLMVNESTYVPLGTVPRRANPGDVPVRIIEVQCGDRLGEDDIVLCLEGQLRSGGDD